VSGFGLTKDYFRIAHSGARQRRPFVGQPGDARTVDVTLRITVEALEEMK
jgi:hypothetical protein